VSAWWLAGGTALLDTVGGGMERLARDRSATALLLGGAVVAAKLVAAVLALALLRGAARPVRLLALVGGGLLVLWGGANVVVGGAVLTGAVDVGPVADPRALRWHVLFWDAWFLVWGLALVVAARAGRPAGRSAVDPAPLSRPRPAGGDRAAQPSTAGGPAGEPPAPPGPPARPRR
jgi:hypothetical protein